MVDLAATGDLARSFLLSGRNTALQTRAETLTRELSSGETADTSGRLKGDLAPLASIERGLTQLDSYRLTRGETATRAEAMQRALATVTERLEETGASLLQTNGEGASAMSATAGVPARGAFLQAASALNTEAGGRALFAGAATDGDALAPGEDMLAAIETAVAGASTAGDVVSAVEDWFRAPGGGFETSGYTGADTPAGPVQIGPQTRIEMSVTAADGDVRAALEGLAMGALLTDETLLAGAPGERAELARTAGERAIGASAGIAGLRGEIGSVESRADAAGAAIEAESDALARARDRLVGIDPYETATELQQVQSQIETLFTLTGRLAELDLAKFLR